jgi:predicted O-methyltransferase YrrM
MMMYLRARGNASLRSELADLLRAHGPFDRLPAQVRSRLKLDDPATYAEIAPPADEHGYRYTTRWFQTSAKATWDTLIPQIDPARILEIGSFEGASSCYLIDTLSRGKSIELHCVDTWEGGVEHQDGGGAQSDMSGVERRFLDNIRLASDRAAHPVSLHVHKGRSDIMMAKLLAEGFECHFDFVYIDGSHQAPDVLCDAVLGFRLLRDGGVIAFDDYLWHESLPYGVDPIRCPKPAIDAFTNLYCRKLAIMPLSSYQLYARKLSD